MNKHQFLSDAWIVEARRLRSEHTAAAPAAPPVRFNLVITGAPDVDRLYAFLDTSSGAPEIELGEIQGADATVTTDYELAKSVFVEGNMSAAMEGLQLGRVRVDGDMMKLMALAGVSADPGSVALAKAIKEMTAD